MQPFLSHCDPTFHDVFFQAGAALAVVDLSGKFLHANAAISEILGYTQSELLARLLSPSIHPEDNFQILAAMNRLNEGCGPCLEMRARLIHKSGRELSGKLTITPMRDASGHITRFIIYLQDETDRIRIESFENDRRTTLEMIAQDQPLPSVLHQLARLVERQIAGTRACLMLLSDGAMRPFHVSLAPEFMDAMKRQSLAFTANLSAPLEYAEGQVRVAGVDADLAWEGLRDEARAANIRCCWALPIIGDDGSALGLLVAFRPDCRTPLPDECEIFETAARLMKIAIEHHLTTRQLAHLVRHDALTGLPNRIMFEDRLHQALATARRNQKPLALLAMDLNRFKEVNDTLGHHAGDALLQQFSQRVRGKLRVSDTLARVGGDEFMLILPDVTSRTDAEAVARRVTQGLASAQFELPGRTQEVTSSIGVALFPADGEDALQLQRAADAAMYRAKEQSRSQRGPATIPQAGSA